MQHTAVMAGLLLPDAVFLFEQSDFGAGETLSQSVRSSQPNDAAADDDCFPGIHWWIL